MKITIEIPYNIGDRVWALIDDKPIEVDICGYYITGHYNQTVSITYKVTRTSSAGQVIEVSSNDVYPSKSAIQLKLTELEDVRHSEVLTFINSI